MPCDKLSGARPGRVGVRVVGGPHNVSRPETIDEIHSYFLKLKGGMELPFDILTGQHGQGNPFEVTEAIIRMV